MAMTGTSKHRLMQETGLEDMTIRTAIHKLLLYFKSVNNLCPSYFNELLPLQVCETTNYSLRTTSNYSFSSSRTERFKRSFCPSTSMLWINISLDIRLLRVYKFFFFKQALFSFFNVPSYNILYNFAFDRVNAISHTCFCGFHTETVKHFFFTVLSILPLGQICSLLRAARVFADRWTTMHVLITNNISFSIWYAVSAARAK